MEYVIAIGGFLVLGGFGIVWRETRIIHKVVNSRLTAALEEIKGLREVIVELRSTAESRRIAEGS